MKFYPGDVVRLKSGSPKLIITEIDGIPEKAWVSWVHQGRMESALLPAVCLRKEKCQERKN